MKQFNKQQQHFRRRQVNWAFMNVSSCKVYQTIITWCRRHWTELIRHCFEDTTLKKVTAVISIKSLLVKWSGVHKKTFLLIAKRGVGKLEQITTTTTTSKQIKHINSKFIYHYNNTFIVTLYRERSICAGDQKSEREQQQKTKITLFPSTFWSDQHIFIIRFSFSSFLFPSHPIGKWLWPEGEPRHVAQLAVLYGGARVHVLPIRRLGAGRIFTIRQRVGFLVVVALNCTLMRKRERMNVWTEWLSECAPFPVGHFLVPRATAKQCKRFGQQKNQCDTIQRRPLLRQHFPRSQLSYISFTFPRNNI